MKTYLYSLLFLMLGITCQSGTNNKQPEDGSEEVAQTIPIKYHSIAPGVLVNPVRCATDRTQSYAAYLPSNYDSLKKYPLLLCFDAHAGGRIPVEKYKALAEKYGYVLVGSNNSKNGLDPATVQTIASTYKNDVMHRFSINPNRIYVCGFSGGARVAAQIALQGEAQGLISCSAGFPPQQNMNFSFLGFAGTEDFNSNELLNLNNNLDATGISHQLILFEGKHEWPTAEIFEEAFIWLDFAAMKNKVIPLNQNQVDNYVARQSKKISKLKSGKQLLEQYRELDKTANFVFGLSKSDALLKERTQLEQLPSLRKEFNDEASIQKREMDLQNYYREAMQQQTPQWWLGEIDNLMAQAESTKNSSKERLMLKRTLSFLSLMTYMTISSAIKQEQFEAANKYLLVYEKVDKDNPEVYYLQAEMAAHGGNPNLALSLLQKAVDKDFQDVQRLLADHYFESLRSDVHFQDLVQRMHQIN